MAAGGGVRGCRSGGRWMCLPARAVLLLRCGVAAMFVCVLRGHGTCACVCALCVCVGPSNFEIKAGQDAVALCQAACCNLKQCLVWTVTQPDPHGEDKCTVGSTWGGSPVA